SRVGRWRIVFHRDLHGIWKAIEAAVIDDQFECVRSECRGIERWFCRAGVNETPAGTADLPPVEGNYGPIRIRRSAPIQRDQCRQASYRIYLIWPGYSDRPESIEVFRGPDVHAVGINAGITIEVELTASGL